MSEYAAGEYAQPLVRVTNLSCPVFPGKVTGRLRLQQAPVPVSAGLAAVLSTNLTGANNDLVFTAAELGTVGNATTVAYVNSGANQTLDVSVTDSDIVVNLATNGSSAITSTAAAVLAAVTASAEASALVSVALKTGNSGAGVVTAMTETALSAGANPVPATGVSAQVELENPGTTAVTLKLRECSNYAAATARYTLATVTLVPGGQKSVSITPSKTYLEVHGVTGPGQVRLQISSKLRWDETGFQKTDPTYPVELCMPIAVPAVDGSSG